MTDRPSPRFNRHLVSTIWKVGLAIGLLNLITLSALGAAYRLHVELTVDRCRALVRLQAQHLAALMANYADPLVGLAARLGSTADSPSAAQAMLDDLTGRDAFDGGIALVDRAGQVIAAVGPLREQVGQTWADRPDLPAAEAPFSYSNILSFEPDGSPMLALSVPVSFSGAPMTLIGLFRFDDPSPFYAALSRHLRSWQEVAVYLLDGDGRAIYPPGTSQTTIARLGVLPMLADKQDAVWVNRANGKKTRVGAATIQGTPWVVVGRSYRQPDGAIRQLGVPFGLWLCGVLISVWAVWTVRRAIRPLDALIRAVRYATDGDPTGQSAATAGDNLEGLVEKVNRLAARLRERDTGLDRRADSRIRELSALYQVATVAYVSLDLDETLARSLEQVLTVMGCEIGMVHLLDRDGESLHLVVEQGISTQEAHKTVALHAPDLIAWVFGRDEVVCLNLAEAPYPLHAWALADARPYLGTPMQITGRTVGVLSVIGAPGRRFDADECTVLAAMAGQIAVTVENVRLRAEAEQVALLQERERLARDLHDSVTQSLYSLTLWIEAGQRSLRAGDLAHVEEYLNRLEEGTRQAIRDMRLLVYELRPPDLEEEGLVGALQERLDAVEKRSGVQARLRVEGKIDLPPKVEEGLYRIAQEALNNALKHAAASAVEVRLQVQDGQVILEISDNGIGFDRQADNRGGMGLANMRQRAAQLGGTLDIMSLPGQGTQIRASIPFRTRP